MVIGVVMSCNRNEMRLSTRFFLLPVQRSSTASTEAAPSARQRSQRCEPRKPAPPRTTTCFPFIEATAMASGYSAGAPLDLVESRLTRQDALVLLQDQIDSLPDVLGDRNLGLRIEKLE